MRVTIPAPGPWLAINDRDHWAVRARKTRVWRQAAAILVRQSLRRARVEGIHGPVECHAAVCKPTRVRFDLDGATATVKACIDGARDGGLLDADDVTTLVRLVVEPGPIHKPTGAVVLTFTAARVPCELTERNQS